MKSALLEGKQLIVDDSDLQTYRGVKALVGAQIARGKYFDISRILQQKARVK